MNQSYKLFRAALLSLTFILLLSPSQRSFAEEQFELFPVGGVDTSGFPRLKLNFLIKDRLNDKLLDPDPEQEKIRLFENGTEITSKIIRSHCTTDTGPTELSVILAVDISGSMDERPASTPERTRMSLVREALTNFVDKVNFYKRTAVAITAWGTIIDTAYSSWDVYRNVLSRKGGGFLQNKDTLKKTIARMDPPRGGTNFNAPFFDNFDKWHDSTRVLFRMKMRPPEIRRIVIFLTDGKHEAATDTVRTQEIIDSLKAIGTAFYSITVFRNGDEDPRLERIARETGGIAFRAETREELNRIYDLLAVQVQTSKYCQIEWEDTFVCSDAERTRTLEMTFKRPPLDLKTNVTYVLPKRAIASLESSPKIVFFGNVEAGNTVTRTITIKAKNSPYIIDQLTFDQKKYFSVKSVKYRGRDTTLPFNLAVDDSVIVELSYTAGTDNYTEDRLLFATSKPCPTAITLVGGPFVKFVTPVVNQQISTCDSLPIEWAGVDPTDLVNLQYRVKGSTGNFIPLVNGGVTGLKYKWKPNLTPGDYEFRVYSPTRMGIVWSNQIGGTENEEALSVAADSLDRAVYVGGYFEGTANFGGTSLNSIGGRDGYLAKYSSGGKLVWVKTITNPQDAEIRSVALDNLDNIYVTGYFQRQANFGGRIEQNNTAKDSFNIFIAKYSSDATPTPQWVVVGKGDNDAAFGYSIGDSIGFLSGNYNEIVVLGRSRYSTRIASEPVVSNNQWSMLYVKLRPDGMVDTAANNVNSSPEILKTNFPRKKDTVKLNASVYEVGTFTDTLKYKAPLTNLIPKGKKDAFIQKTARILETFDIVNVSIVKPELQLISSNVTWPTADVKVGTPDYKSFTGHLKNVSSVPITITNAYFSGKDRTEFTTDGLKDLVVPANSSIDVKINFEPKTAGDKTATLNIEGNGKGCTYVALVINAKAIPGCDIDVLPNYAIGSSALTITTPKAIPAAIKNNNDKNLDYNLTITNDALSEFSLKAPISGTLASGESLTINVDFTPKQEGPRTATINYGILAECGAPQTVINGVGITPQLTVAPLAMGVKRVNTTHPGKVEVTNFEESTAVIDSIRIVPGTNFKVTGSNTKNIIVKGLNTGDNKFLLDVEFTPQVLGPITETVEVYQFGKSAPITAELTGIGAIPTLRATGFIFDAAEVGKKSSQSGQITIKNESPDMELTIFSIDKQPGDNLDFDIIGAPTATFTIAPNDTKIIPVDFTPQSFGNRLLPLIVKSDGADGNDPHADSLISLQGVGLAVGVDSVIEIKCLQGEGYFVISNFTGGTGLDINNFSVSGPDADAFTILKSPGYKISGDVADTVRVRFTPKKNGISEAWVDIGNKSDGANPTSHPLRVHLIGDGNKTPVTISMPYNKTISPGEEISLPLTITAGDLSAAPIKNFTIDLTYSPVQLLFKGATGSTGWNILPSDIAGGKKLTISGLNSIGGNPNIGEVKFIALLTNQPKAEIVITAGQEFTNDCIELSAPVATLDMSGLCFQGGRAIRLGNAPFSISSPNPNPASSDVNITFGVGFEAPVLIELHNSMSQKVMTVVDGNLVSGTYEAKIPVENLPSGIYFYTMTCGPYKETRQLVITK